MRIYHLLTKTLYQSTITISIRSNIFPLSQHTIKMSNSFFKKNKVKEVKKLYTDLSKLELWRMWRLPFIANSLRSTLTHIQVHLHQKKTALFSQRKLLNMFSDDKKRQIFIPSPERVHCCSLKTKTSVTLLIGLEYTDCCIHCRGERMFKCVILDMILNCIRWWGSNFWDLWSVESPLHCHCSLVD